MRTPDRLGRLPAGGVSAEVMQGLVDLRGVRWEGLDLSYAQLPSLRFFESVIEGCRLDAASCRDWRLWASTCCGVPPSSLFPRATSR